MPVEHRHICGQNTHTHKINKQINVNSILQTVSTIQWLVIICVTNEYLEQFFLLKIKISLNLNLVWFLLY